MTKKQMKTENNKHRNTWGDISPVTRVVKSAKAYTRKEKHKAKYNY